MVWNQILAMLLPLQSWSISHGVWCQVVHRTNLAPAAMRHAAVASDATRVCSDNLTGAAEVPGICSGFP